MAIFILAPDPEFHADRIEWGLKKCGFEVIRWAGLGWQAADSASIQLGEHDALYLGDRSLGQHDTVWLRRPVLKTHPDVDDGEKKFAEREYEAFKRTLLLHIELTGARCINKWSVARNIENKSLQLSLARKCGLRVPSTMMSNCAGFVRGSLNEADADLVHKVYLAHAWIQPTGAAVYNCETTRLRRDCSLPDETFAYAPGIYQQRILKTYDVRINMLGRDFHSFKLTTPATALDWRSHGLNGKLRVERTTLPASVESGLRRFADKADIAFGCFDMVVDAKGDWWFLEVNQAGQFLWIDDLLPDDGLYQPMLRFLSSGESSATVTFPTYRQCISECPMKSYAEPLTNDSPFLTIERI